MAITDDAGKLSRRAFLARASGACIAFIALLLGVPAAGAVVGPALRREEADWAELGEVSGFPEGVPTPAEFSIARRDGWIQTTESKAVWVVRGSGDEVTVFNGRCTHLGCAYRWDAEKNQFSCPCHAGVFARDGKVLSGPPPRSLDALPTRIESGSLLVKYVEFRLGTAERVPS